MGVACTYKNLSQVNRAVRTFHFHLRVSYPSRCHPAHFTDSFLNPRPFNFKSLFNIQSAIALYDGALPVFQEEQELGRYSVRVASRFP